MAKPLNVQAIKLDSAIAQLLDRKISDVDRVHLQDIQETVQASVALRDQRHSLNLVEALMKFIMPELTDMSVLQLDRQFSLLETLSNELSSAAEADMPEVKLIIDDELRRLNVLKSHYNSLVRA